MTIVPDCFEDESVVQESAVERLSKIAEDMLSKEIAIEMLEAELKSAQNELKEYQTKIAVEIMAEFGVSDFTTKSGIRLVCEDNIFASFPKEDEGKRARAFQYLRDSGNSGLIRGLISVEFNPGSDKAAQILRNTIEAYEIGNVATVIDSTTLNHQSMLKFLRDSLKEGADIPLDAFGAIRKTTVKIKKAKTRK